MKTAVSPEETTNEKKVETDRFSLRFVYFVLIVTALGIAFGKIASVDSAPDRAIQNYRLAQIPKTLETRAKELSAKNLSEEQFNREMTRIYTALTDDAMKARPTLCANDRSRWATIRALVEKDARVYRFVPTDRSAPYADGDVLRNCASDCPEKNCEENRRAESYRKELVPYAIDKAWETPGWESIDVVKHGLNDEDWNPANPASGYMYSSKPTLLPTVMAAPYWILNRWFGLSLVEKPFTTVRILLVFYNLIPLALAFWCLASIIDAFGATHVSRAISLAILLFCSYLLTFSATLNNHIPGVACISIALWAAFKILAQGRAKVGYFFLAGFFGAFAVACELPALAFAGLLCLALLVRRPKGTILVSIPAGLIVVAAFFGTNYIAHQTLKPAYAHKRDHMALAAQAAANEGETVANEDERASASSETPEFSRDDWYYYNYYPSGAPREAKYARLSHWANRTGIDRGEPSIGRYAFHSTIGLRGVFSLTPTWALSLLAFCVILTAGLARRADEPRDVQVDRFAKIVAGIGGVLTLVFFAFFMTRDQGDRNYGGMSCYPRWFFPLTPIFAVVLPPLLDRALSSRAFRVLLVAAIFWSAAGAFYAPWSPWVHPWLYQIALDWNLIQPY